LWEKLAEERSGGRLQIELYPSSQLGSKLDVVEQAMLGSNVIHITDASFLMDYVADLGILSAPYLTDDYDQLFYLLETDWFKELEKELNDKGLYIVDSNWIFGTRHLIADRKVSTPEDLKGLKIRVPNNKLAIDTIEAIGGTATPMPLGELYPALQQGIVNGSENPLPVMMGNKLHETAKFISLTSHMRMIAQWVGGTKFIETLPDDLLQILKEAAKEAGMANNENVNQVDMDLMEQFKQEGVTITEVDPSLFRERALAVYDKMEWSPNLYEKIQDLLSNR